MVVEAHNLHQSKNGGVNLTVPYLSSIITRHNTSLPVAKIVAKVIDKPVREVFPEMFNHEIKHLQRQQQVEDLSQRLAS